MITDPFEILRIAQEQEKSEAERAAQPKVNSRTAKVQCHHETEHTSMDDERFKVCDFCHRPRLVAPVWKPRPPVRNKKVKLCMFCRLPETRCECGKEKEHFTP